MTYLPLTSPLHSAKVGLSLRILSSIGILLAIAMLALILSPGSTEATITGDQPPASGDWVVTYDTVVSNEVITIRGDLVVKANLTISDSTVRLMPLSDGADMINVTPGGRLVAIDTLIFSGTEFAFGFLVTGEMVLESVVVQHPYLGIRVVTDDDILIANTTIRDPVDTAILLDGADGTVLRNVMVRANDFHPRMSSSVDVPAATRYAELELIAPGLVRVLDGAPSIEGLDISINGTLMLDLGMVKKGSSATLDMLCRWPMLEVDTREDLVLSDVVFRESTVNLEVNLGIHNEVAGGIVKFNPSFQVVAVLLRNYRSIGLEDAMGWNITQLYTNRTTTETGLPFDGTEIRSEYDRLVLIAAVVDETFTSKGPHTFDLSITDARTNGISVLEYYFFPGYTGGQRPTFDTRLLIDGAKVVGGEVLFYVDTEPAFATAFDRFHSDLRFSNSSFAHARGKVIETHNVDGPSEDLVIENCTFSNGHLSVTGLLDLALSRAKSNNLPNRIDIHRNVFNNSNGQLISVSGPGYGVSRLDQLSISNNIFFNNSYWGEAGFWVIANVGRVVIENNSFEDNWCALGIVVFHQGGWRAGATITREPCDLRILNNSFKDNTVLAPEKVIEGFIEVTWGGQLNVEGNEIEGVRGIFLNLSEITEFSSRSTLDFHDNDIHDNDGTILFFHQTDANHSDLSVLIEDNRAWDNAGPLTDYPKDSPGFAVNTLMDYDARFEFINNTVVGSTAPVFIAYGNLSARDNTFTDCSDYALQFENLRMSQPSIVGNVFTRCGNVISLTAKDSAPTHVLLWMDGNLIDCTGVALYLRYMELTMRNTNITSTASPTVIAEISKIDAYNCQLDPDRAVVDYDGYINVWFWVEARVEWANTTGVASGNPVPGANVTFFDTKDQWAATEFADAEGRLGPVTILQWYIEHSFDPVVLSPFKVATSLSSFHSETSLVLNRSYVGKDALLLLLVDPVAPHGTVDAPLDGEMFNITDIQVLAWSEDTGSGIFRVNITIVGFDSVELPYNGSNEYEHLFENVPEGQLVVRVTFTDAGLNHLVLVRVIEVDATPPILLITSPSQDMLTNASFVMLTGRTDADAVLTVNMRAVAHAAGEFDHKLDLTEGLNHFEVLAEDEFGNRVFLVLHVTRDSIPPELLVSAPRDQLGLNRTTVEIVGIATGQDALLVSVLRQNTDIIGLVIETDEMGHFVVEVEMEEGLNVIVVTALDAAGNEVVVRRTVLSDTTPPTVEIISPVHGTLTNQASVPVVFEVGEDADQVYINGRRILATGTLEQNVLLVEGMNNITVRVLDVLLNEAMTSMVVFMDTQVPGLVIISPNITEIWTNDPVIEVAGTVDKSGVMLSVMGVNTPVVGGEWHVTLTLPEDGTHVVAVLVEDQAGNVARSSFLVHLSTVPPLLLVSYDPPITLFFEEGYVRVYGTTTEHVDKVSLGHFHDGNESWIDIPLLGPSFTYIITLVDGENSILVKVEDVFGNHNATSSHDVTLIQPQDELDTNNNTAWTIAVILLVAVVILVALVYLMRYRSSGPGPDFPGE